MNKVPMGEFARRREDLMAHLEAQSIVIVPSAQVHVRNRDVEYPFRQDSDFYYLSGFDEPDAVLVLIPGRTQGQSILFCRERDVDKELWHGRRAGTEGACADYAFDDAFPITDIDDILPGLIEGRRRVYYAMGRIPDFDRRLMNWVNTIRAKTRSGAHPPGEFVDLDYLLHEMRLIKCAAEIKLMRRAAQISARAHARAMRFCRADVFEYQLEAELVSEFQHSGSRGWAYPSIVGGGENACVLHYTSNSDRLRDGDLVLIDAGCELDYYASDITRTFPVSGRFSKPQRELYQVCLAAQSAALDAIKPGASWDEPHAAAVATITEGLVELGLLQGQVTELVEKGAYQRFYMHRTGHWLGMDVHDVGEYKIGDQWRLLEAGMVLTVEPGIYVAPDDQTVASEWRGIGIRIEDDVVVTEQGFDVLSKDVPKEIDQIEALMAQSG